MNIFVLDTCPITAAEYQCDKHVVKMILESAQLLCSPFDKEDNPPYRRTHYNHPCAKWVRASVDNFEWLFLHAMALCEEYTHRYGRVHKSKEAILWARLHWYSLNLPRIGPTPFVQCMPENCKGEDTVYAYRKYYREHKRHFAKWTKREIPEWWYDTANTLAERG